MVDHRSPEREVEGSILTQVAVLYQSLSKIHLPPKKYRLYSGSGCSIPTELKIG